MDTILPGLDRPIRIDRPRLPAVLPTSMRPRGHVADGQAVCLPNGVPGPSASTACGATVASRSALVSGPLADAFGIRAAVAVVGTLTGASGLVVAARMRGTDHLRPGPPAQSSAASPTSCRPEVAPTISTGFHTTTWHKGSWLHFTSS